MPHLSRQKLDRRTAEKIDAFLTRLFAQAHGEIAMQTVLSAALTPTERIMIAKRISIIFLLVHDESMYTVAEALNVSPSTVARYRWQVDNGGFDDLIAYLPVRSSIRNKRFDRKEMSDDYTGSFFAFFFAFLGSAANTKRFHELHRRYGR